MRDLNKVDIYEEIYNKNKKLIDIEVYLPILKEEILELEYSKELFERDMNSYIKEYMKKLKKKM